MDPLSDILTNLDLRGILYFAAEFNPPWGARVPAFENVVRFHLVIRGQAFVGLEGSGERIALSPGDFALIPFGAAHELADSANGKTFALDRVLEDAGYDGSGRLVFGVTDRALQSRLLCGHFTFDHRSPARLFLNALPPVILVRQQETALAAWLDSTVQMLADEEAAPKPGRDAILRRVAELLFVQAMRHHLNEAKLPSGILRGLADPQIARALAAIHSEPQADWGLETLASLAGLSRTVFAERFRTAVGETPAAYVTAWRLEKARSLLLDGNHTVDDVASSVGYASTPAFTRAFSSRFGEPPGAIRRAARN